MNNRHSSNRSQNAGFCRKHADYKQRKKDGWGKNLYRNKDAGKIAGVCAGLADHWDIAHWVVRLMFIMGLIFSGTLTFWVYIAGWILLAPRSESHHQNNSSSQYSNPVDMEYDEKQQHFRPKKMFRYSESSSVRLRRARERLDAALHRVESMEAYVTSSKYNLNKEFSKL
jgi:phage shock protein C